MEKIIKMAKSFNKYFVTKEEKAMAFGMCVLFLLTVMAILVGYALICMKGAEYLVDWIGVEKIGNALNYIVGCLFEGWTLF